MLILIVGPSGAGKDTLLNGVRTALGEQPAVRFVRRVITRPVGAGEEDHASVTEAVFLQRQEAGDFALSWRAHGLYYGIPADIALDLAQERIVIANVSRAVVAEAAKRFTVAVIEISAPADILARRLAARGREDAVDVARRLSPPVGCRGAAFSGGRIWLRRATATSLAHHPLTKRFGSRHAW